MELIFSPKALSDIELLKKSAPLSTKKRLERILASITDTPYEGFANPEALRHDLAGKWSRELSKKDRVVYYVENNEIIILSLLGHYFDK